MIFQTHQLGSTNQHDSNDQPNTIRPRFVTKGGVGYGVDETQKVRVRNGIGTNGQPSVFLRTELNDSLDFII